MNVSVAFLSSTTAVSILLLPNLIRGVLLRKKERKKEREKERKKGYAQVRKGMRKFFLIYFVLLFFSLKARLIQWNLYKEDTIGSKKLSAL